MQISVEKQWQSRNSILVNSEKESFVINGGEKKLYKCKNASWVHMHTTSKLIELESPGCSGFEDLSISF